MSVLTKVLVTLLAFLSVALSMLVVSAFAQQQNWKASAEDWQQAAMTAQSQARTVSMNAALDKARSLDRQKQDGQRIEDLKAELASAEALVSEMERTVAESATKLTVEQGQVTSTSEALKLVQTDLNREREFSAKMARRNSELERANIDLTDRVKELTTNVEMARAQVRALQQQIAGATGAAMPAAGGYRSSAQIPSPAQSVEENVPSVSTPAISAVAMPIRGEVVSIKGDLASISVGAADGVAHGMSFLIYRRSGAGGRPQFLGTLRITRVDANQAAGQIEQSEGDIRVGDLARDEASFAMRG
ncbi:MAG: hypothetical protein DCC65_00560 [Planctomycetota bacterium]|nr:MAG: hypothetical protein DCC65_00560 [Planctomycetota bacterium]